MGEKQNATIPEGIVEKMIAQFEDKNKTERAQAHSPVQSNETTMEHEEKPSERIKVSIESKLQHLSREVEEQGLADRDQEQQDNAKKMGALKQNFSSDQATSTSEHIYENEHEEKDEEDLYYIPEQSTVRSAARTNHPLPSIPQECTKEDGIYDVIAEEDYRTTNAANNMVNNSIYDHINRSLDAEYMDMSGNEAFERVVQVVEESINVINGDEEAELDAALHKKNPDTAGVIKRLHDALKSLKDIKKQLTKDKAGNPERLNDLKGKATEMRATIKGLKQQLKDCSPKTYVMEKIRMALLNIVSKISKLCKTLIHNIDKRVMNHRIITVKESLNSVDKVLKTIGKTNDLELKMEEINALNADIDKLEARCNDKQAVYDRLNDDYSKNQTPEKSLELTVKSQELKALNKEINIKTSELNKKVAKLELKLENHSRKLDKRTVELEGVNIKIGQESDRIRDGIESKHNPICKVDDIRLEQVKNVTEKSHNQGTSLATTSERLTSTADLLREVKSSLKEVEKPESWVEKESSRSQNGNEQGRR